MIFYIISYNFLRIFWSVFGKKDTFIEDYPSLMHFDQKSYDTLIEYSDLIELYMTYTGGFYEKFFSKKEKD